MQYYNLKRNWNILKQQITDRIFSQNLTEDQKFCSFFKNTLLPRKVAVKFTYVLNNCKRKEISSHAAKKFLTPTNKYILSLIINCFVCFYVAVFSIYYDIEESYKYEDRELLSSYFYSLTVFNVFIKMFFSEYFFNNENIQTLSISYLLDKMFYDTFINYFNFYLFLKLKIFEVILHFEKFKYEEDLILYGEEKAEKKKLLINNFDINLLNFQDNFFFSFTIYEFHLYFNDYLFNYFNSEFFSKTKIILSNNINFKTKIIKDTYFLTSLYFEYCTEFLDNNKKARSLLKKRVYSNYKALNIKKEKKFNVNKHLLNLTTFGIRMPYLFYLLYTWYSIFYRRSRYNLYIRGFQFFQEYISRMHYFIWANNPFGKNKTKMYVYKYSKLFTISHLKSYVEINWFNNWFFFYSAYKTYLVKYVSNDKKMHEKSFSILLNNLHINNLIQSTNMNRTALTIFFDEHLLWNDCNYELLKAYALFMKTPVVKFSNTFKFGRLSFFEYERMIEVIYYLDCDKYKLKKSLEYELIISYYFEIFHTSYLNLYFVKDLYNFKNVKELQRSYNIIGFYDKLFSIIFLLIDPFFFKYFWKRSFPRKLHKFWNIYKYIWANSFIYKADYTSIEFKIKSYSFLMYFLTWRIDTSSSVGMNFAYTDSIVYTYSIINMLYKNRFIELLKQINSLLYINNISNKWRCLYYYYLINLKNYYYDLLDNNIEYYLTFFFNYTKNFLNMILNYKNLYIKEFIYSNFLYRYYTFAFLLERHYYADWFQDWNKRIFWIFKNIRNHEGPLFYSKDFKHIIL